MTYTLRFSDAAKTETVVVPDMPPGINTIDTSLSLVGRNYPNYGEKIAENFLHLLENFASPLPPENPIEGQLWYDTSDPNNKVLRVMDGTAESTRWPSANGIYQQGTDPKTTSAALKVGDIWVDTQNNLLKIYHSGDWTVVGPSISSGLTKTGVEPAVLESTTGTNHNVIMSYVNGNVLAITANSQFTPKTLIDGFTILRPGINVSVNNNAILNGTADQTLNLRINNQKYSANRVLIKDDSALTQIITGRLFFQTPSNQLNSEGRDGIVIDNGAISNNTYIQFYKLANDAVILNNTVGGKIVFKTKPTINSNLITGMVIENKSVAINTGTNSAYALDINGSLRVSGNVLLSSTSSNSVSIAGTTVIGQDLIVEKSLRIKNQATVTNLLTVGSNSGNGTVISPAVHNVYDIGSTTRYFRSLYVTTIGSTGTGTTLYGCVIGNATGLEKSSEFRLQGQITAPSFIFAGTGTSATFVTSLTPSAITGQQNLITATSTLNLLVVDTSTSAVHTGLRQINRADFLRDVSFTGMITAYGSNVAPSGWLLCNGSAYSTSTYSKLWTLIENIYGNNLPNLTNVTTATGGKPVYYIIKT